MFRDYSGDMTRAFLLMAVLVVTTVVAADEGMWTTHNFPREAVKQEYGVTIDDAWLQKLQQSVVRLESGCTGSFVSPDGLILTNHHCAQTCIAESSTAQRDLVANGFVSPDRAEEVRCQGEAVSVLMETENITPAVTKAMTGVAPAQAARVRNETLTTLETRCEEGSKKAGAALKCESVSLYQGGQYWLYKYKRFDDIRLAFAPEHAVAAFGGDPDNFQFPRWCLDMSLLRAYEGGKPAATPTHLSFNWAGAKEKEPVFVAGHPGTTQRQLTVAQLKTERDLVIPFWLLRFSELRGRLIQYSKASPEAARTAKDYLDTIENTIKVRRQQLFALLDDRLMEQKVAEQQKLRAFVKADASLGTRVDQAWEDIAVAQAALRNIYTPYVWLEGGAGFNTDFFAYARQIVRAADERSRANADRLREYTDARLTALQQALAADTPIYPELEKVRLSYSLERMREWLGPDHPMVKLALGTMSPDERAKALIEGTKLANPKVRLALLEGGAKAVAESTDPMIQLARDVDADARRLRKIFETEVDGPVQRAQQLISEARFKAFGTSLYPDATFTLRVTYGAVDGWIENGLPVDPFTRLARMYERTTGQPPFALPKRWLDAKSSIDLSAAANFTATTDIIGGNSGSPMVNAAGQIVGLVFDGNIHSIAGSYWFDPDRNRTIAVHPDFIRTALGRVYPAKALAAELKVPR
jgi:V8-like Glu-specific endopeptidase